VRYVTRRNATHASLRELKNMRIDGIGKNMRLYGDGGKYMIINKTFELKIPRRVTPVILKYFRILY